MISIPFIPLNIEHSGARTPRSFSISLNVEHSRGKNTNRGNQESFANLSELKCSFSPFPNA